MLVSGRGYSDTNAMNLFDAEQREILNSDPFTRDISNRIYIVSWLNYMTLNKLHRIPLQIMNTGTISKILSRI